MEKVSVGLMELPNETLIRILRFLPNADIHRNVAYVCKRFSELSIDPLFVLEIDINQDQLKIGTERTILNHPSKKEICDFLTKSRHLRKLTIRARQDVEFLGLKAIKNCPSLSELEILAGPDNILKLEDDAIACMFQWADKIIA